MKNVDHDILKLSIEELVDVQKRGSWKKILIEFNIHNKNSFYDLVDDEDSIRDTIGRLCKVIRMDLEVFRSFYKYMLANKSKHKA